jgi:predicted nuclease of restriction endonuclease-like (RecB) superfamily
VFNSRNVALHTIRGVYDTHSSSDEVAWHMPSARRNRSQLVRSAVVPARGYHALLRDIKERIRTAQIKVSLAVNRELIQLYWDIGGLIVSRQRAEGWGNSIVERLASDIRKDFPGVEGFSPRNVWRMRAFYLAWGPSESMPITVQKKNRKELPQAVADLDRRSPPQPVAEIPWGHNVILLEKLTNSDQRLWYARQVIAGGWSRSMLEHWIDSELYSRQGKAVTNFKTALAPPQSDLAREIMRDPYNFDFLSLREQAEERELEDGLLAHMRKFLIELGAGFAFVGQQTHLMVDGEDYYIDLLFYHLKLRSYVVIDLKTTRFKPEYVGKMNFYLSAVDDQLRHEDDKLSIGIILCKTRSEIVAEYALRNLAAPVGVARYTTKLVESLPAELQGALPSPKEIEAELQSQQSKAQSS